MQLSENIFCRLVNTILIRQYNDIYVYHSILLFHWLVHYYTMHFVIRLILISTNLYHSIQLYRRSNIIFFVSQHPAAYYKNNNIMVNSRSKITITRMRIVDV